MELINSLILEGWLKTPRIIEAFKKIKRVDFLPENLKSLSELNQALPIGFGQTISQPLVVAFMMELLQPEPGNIVLDIGSGSGWTTAILSEIVGLKGKVFALEIIPELKDFGEKNVSKYNFVAKGIASFFCCDGSKGYKEGAPYDRILASAFVVGEIPVFWKEQLKIGGRMVVPVGNSICLFIKEQNKKIEKYCYPGFAFVPLVKR
jgi:protein-L-isoaspartate(D-aspartate) O-methyltransferase